MVGKMKINVESIDVCLYRLLFDSCETERIIGEIHSVYKNVVNIIDTNNNIFITIANRKVPNGPNVIRLSQQIDFTNNLFKLKPSIYIRKVGNEIQLNEKLCLRFSNAFLWKKKSDLINMKQKIDFEPIASLLDSIIFTKGNDGGMKKVWHEFLKNQKTNQLNLHEKALLSNLKKLDLAITHKEEVNIFKNFQQFIGLGPGLTPAGDDFFVGCLSILQVFQNQLVKLFSFNSDSLLNCFQSKTTTVSFFMIKFALLGRYNELLDKFLSKLATSNLNEIRIQAEKLIEIGSSSGTDMLVGVRFALYKAIEEDIKSGVKGNY